MASFGIRIQSVVAAALYLIILRSVDGGRTIPVGGLYGWNYIPTSPDNDTSKFSYQEWISNLALIATDALGKKHPVSFCIIPFSVRVEAKPAFLSKNSNRVSI